MPLIYQGKFLFFLFFLSVFILTACGSTSPPTSDDSITGFLKNGVTTKEEVYLNLGPPSGFYENERILTYRIMYRSDVGWRVLEKCLPFGWKRVKFSLVLVFNGDNVLQKHSLVDVE